jgi:hypothetical protein
MTQVQSFGGNTTAITNGNTAYIWNDLDKDGRISNGDIVFRLAQEDQSVFSYVVGHGEGMYSWGDPHLDNVAFDAPREQAFVGDLNALFQDARDGSLDDAQLLTAADESLASNGVRSNIGDYHADMVLALGDGRTGIEHDVAGTDVKYNENIDLNLVDANGRSMTVTVREIWADNGGAGQMSVANTTGNSAAQAIADPAALPVLHEYRGANVRNQSTLFGDDAGTADFAHIINSAGQIVRGVGDVTTAAAQAYQSERDGDYPQILAQAFDLLEPTEDREEELR